MAKIPSKIKAGAKVVKKIKIEGGGGNPLQKVYAQYGKAQGINSTKAQKELREKQAFLVLGAPKSGKSSFLNVPGNPFTSSYPPKEVTTLSGAGEGIVQWKFSADSFWIDLPGNMIDTGNTDKLINFCKSYSSFRPKNPLDGILVMLDVKSLASGSRNQLSEMNLAIQNAIILINKHLGITPPVTVIFTNTDSLGGFNDIFGDESGLWDEQYLGIRVSPKDRNLLPRDLIQKEVAGLIEQVRLIEIKMLTREKDPHKRRSITQFPITFTALEKNITDFVEQLLTFPDSSDKCDLSGIFFTSIQGETSENAKSWFIKPLLKEILPSSSGGIGHTTEKSKSIKKSMFVGVGVSAVIVILFIISLFSLSSKQSAQEREIVAKLKQTISFDSKGMANLKAIQETYNQTLPYKDGKKPFGMVFTGYGAKKVQRIVEERYLKALNTAITLPSSVILYGELKKAAQSSTSPIHSDFSGIKERLRAYLSSSSLSKNYQDLFDKDAVSEVITPIVTKRFWGNITPTEEEVQDLDKIISAYLDLIASNKYPYYCTPDIKVIESAQNRLVELFDAKAVYETTIGQIMKNGEKKFLFDLVPEANDVNMNSRLSLHEVYTPDAWKNSVTKEILAASNRVNSVEKWVVGNNENRMTTSFTNPEKLYEKLVGFYLDDVKDEWLKFLGSINLYRFNTLYEGTSVLLKLSSGESAVVKTIGLFSGWGKQFSEENKGDKVGELFIEFGQSMKFLDNLNNGLAPWQKYLKNIADGISDGKKEGNYAGYFNGFSNDPLVGAYKYNRTTLLPQLSSKQKESVEQLFEQPLYRSKVILKKYIAKELEDNWNSKVVNPFKANLAGKYPFSTGKTDASYNATLDYFHPEDGEFWSAYKKYFFGYIIEANGKWKTRSKSGMVPVEINPEVLKTFEMADRITKVLFKKGGKPREVKIQLTPNGRAKLKSAKVTIGEVTSDLVQEKGIKFTWPAENAKLYFLDQNGNPAIKEYRGIWGPVKLLTNSSLIKKGNGFKASFPANLTTTAYAKVVLMPVKIDVSTNVHPFCINPFKGFTVSSKLLK